MTYVKKAVIRSALLTTGSWLGMPVIAAIVSVPAMAQVAPAASDQGAAIPQSARNSGAAVQPDDSQVADIVVTANKREQSINQVGLTITAISGDSLKTQNIVSLADLAKAIPGLTFTPTEAGTPVYTLRGVGFYETSLAAYPDVSVYLDEVPLQMPVMTSLTLFDLERVEALKGPQGTLFGNNATGGAINYIAAKPTNTLEAGASLSYGRFNTAQLETFVSGPVTDTLKMRAAFSTSQGDGWQYSVTRPGDKNGAVNTLAARILADWQPSSGVRFQFNLNGWRDRTEPQQSQFLFYNPLFPAVGALVPVASSPLPPISTANARAADWSVVPPPSADKRFLQAAVRGDIDLSDAMTLTTLTSYADYDQNNVPIGGGTAAPRVALTLDEGYIKSFAQEIRLSNGGKSRFRWVVGANYSHDTVYQNEFVNYSGATASLVFGGVAGNGFDSFQKMNNYAAFVSGEFDVGDLTLKAGVRYSEAHRRSENNAFSRGDYLDNGTAQTAAFIINSVANPIRAAVGLPPIAVPGPFQNFIVNDQVPSTDPNFYAVTPARITLNENNVSWRVGADYKPSSNVLLYFNISKGYKAGSVPTISGSTLTSVGPVTQESVLDYEGGFKLQLFNSRVSFNGAAFYYDYKNKQLKAKYVDPFFGPLDALVNVPKSSIFGAEFDITAVPFAGLTLALNGTYLDAMVDRFTGVNNAGQAGVFDGTRVPYTPRWQFGGSANYKLPLTPEFGGFVGSQVNYRSGTNSSIGGSSEYNIPGYTLVDLQAGVESESGSWKAFVWGKNVTNEYYVTNVLNNTDGRDRFVGMPATYGVTVSLRY